MKKLIPTLVALALLGAGLAVTEPAGAVLSSCAPAIAHRGQSADYPENTEPAVKAALAAGAKVIENDVRFSKSNVPFIFHDGTTGRTTNDTANRNVADMWWGDIVALDHGYPKKFGTKFAGTKPLTFYEWLMLVKNGGAAGLVELKVVPTADQWTAYAQRINDSGAASFIVFQSFDAAVVAEHKRRFPTIPAVLLETPAAAGNIRSNEAIRAAFDGYSVDERYAPADRLAYWRKGGFNLYAWTTDDPARWATLAGTVDGVITNNAAGYIDWATANCGELAPLNRRLARTTPRK